MKYAGLNKIKEKIRLSKEIKDVIWEVGFFLLGFFLMSVRFLFGTFPFGIALIGASKKQMPFIFVGALLSSVLIMENTTLYVVSLIALAGLRIASSFIKKSEFTKTELGQSHAKRLIENLFCEGVEFKVAVTSLVALGIGIYNVIVNGYVYYDVFVLVFYTVLVAILTYCLSGVFEEREKKSFLVGICSLLFSLIYALSGKEIGGMDVMLVLSYAAVLYVSKYFGGIKGAMIGVITGIAQGGILSGVLGIGGLVSGFLWNISPYLSVMSSFILSMGYAISIMGYEAIVSFIPEILASSLIMYPLLRFELLPKPAIVSKGEKGNTMEIFRLENRSCEIKEKMNKLSSVYGDIAKMLRDVSEKTKNPDKRGYYDMALEACEEHCYSCPKESICWQRDMGTTQSNIDKMGEALFVKREVIKTDIDEKFLHRCPNIEKIMEELNTKNKNILAQGVKNDKLDVSAQDYDSVSKMISAVFEKEKNPVIDKQLTDKAVRVCAACGLVCEKIEVFSLDKKVVVATGVDIQKSKCTSLEFKQEMEKGLGIGLKEGETKETDGYVTLKMESENNFKVESFAVTKKDDKEEVNGDSYISFETDSKQYMIICDGMGSGHNAKLTSAMCTELMEKMLTVTDEKEIILSMLNNFLRAKNMECSSSVDLFEFDLLSGNGKFVKSGAAPSFIKRGDNVFKLQSKTAPIGIMKSLDAEELSFTLNKGDICVMVSDGIATSNRDSKWITEFIKDFKAEDIKELAKGLLNEAKKHGSKDDMTVIGAVIN